MRVTESTLEKAVFRIVRQHELEAYASIPFREMQGLWAYTGLRQGDLRDALRSMFEKRYIDFENDGDGLSVVITPEGCERGREHELQVAHLLRDSRDKLTLHQASKRYHTPGHGNPRREMKRRVDKLEIG